MLCRPRDSDSFKTQTRVKKKNDQQICKEEKAISKNRNEKIWRKEKNIVILQSILNNIVE